MKKEMVTKEVITYDPGDILDISRVQARTHKPAANEAEFALVLSKKGKTGYKVLTDRNKCVDLTGDEIEDAQFLKSLDIESWNALVRKAERREEVYV